MRTITRREREKENMRNAILEAATKIIVNEGYENLSMRKIANEIEYTPTTLYNYYKDKMQIVNDIAREVYKKIVSNAKIVIEKNKDVPIHYQLELVFKAFIDTMTSNAEMGKAVIRSGSQAIFGDREEAEAPENNGILMLHNLLLKGQQKSVFRKLDENMSWMLITALIGFSINAIENQLYLNNNWQGVVHTYVELLVHGLLL